MTRSLQSTMKGLIEKTGFHVMRVKPGFRAVRIPKDVDPEYGFFLHQYRTPEGAFDYERYREIQTAGNKSKLDRIFAQEENIAFLSRYIRERIAQPQRGICHGTRRGLEQKWFRDYLGCDVIGTEISDTASQFPHTIQWDFHDVKEEWIKAIDFIYSNSLDHSYDPKKCLNAWMSCVRPGGLCILEQTSENEPSRATERDPFGAELAQMPYLIVRWGAGRYAVREIVPAPVTKNTVSYAYFLVIQRFADDWSGRFPEKRNRGGIAPDCGQ